MGNWGISENANEKEKLKSKMADFLNGLNCCGDIGISTYDEMFDFSMDLLDKMYELGRSERKELNDTCIKFIRRSLDLAITNAQFKETKDAYTEIKNQFNDYIEGI